MEDLAVWAEEELYILEEFKAGAKTKKQDGMLISPDICDKITKCGAD